MDTINCVFNIETSDYQCTIPYIEPLTYNDESSYLLNYWTSGEVVITTLLFIFLMFEIFKFGFEFFYPKLVKIKRIG